MTNFQQIRGLFERATYDALRSAGVIAELVFFDGVQETPPDGSAIYAVVSLSFDQTALDMVGCPVEAIKGSLMCNIYTPKQRGSRPGEDIAAEVLRAWVGLNRAPQTVNRPRVQNIEGPRTIAPDQRPHHCHSMSCSFTAAAA
jgi:hypothetical protein